MVEDILTKVGDAVEGVTEQIGGALMPDASDETKQSAGVALALLLGGGLVFLFRKQLMKPVIRYRAKRGTATRTRRPYYRRRK